jgi:VIT1/CCC1 family predicted Fe2+/Mn2+ transporter
MNATGLEGMMVLITILGAILNAIGLIKSIREHYDLGKYMSRVALALLGAMWIIGLS